MSFIYIESLVLCIYFFRPSLRGKNVSWNYLLICFNVLTDKRGLILLLLLKILFLLFLASWNITNFNLTANLQEA